VIVQHVGIEQELHIGNEPIHKQSAAFCGIYAQQQLQITSSDHIADTILLWLFSLAALWVLNSYLTVCPLQPPNFNT